MSLFAFNISCPFKYYALKFIVNINLREHSSAVTIMTPNEVSITLSLIFVSQCLQPELIPVLFWYSIVCVCVWVCVYNLFIDKLESPLVMLRLRRSSPSKHNRWLYLYTSPITYNLFTLP